MAGEYDIMAPETRDVVRLGKFTPFLNAGDRPHRGTTLTSLLGDEHPIYHDELPDGYLDQELFIPVDVERWQDGKLEHALSVDNEVVQQAILEGDKPPWLDLDDWYYEKCEDDDLLVMAPECVLGRLSVDEGAVDGWDVYRLERRQLVECS